MNIRTRASACVLAIITVSSAAGQAEPPAPDALEPVEVEVDHAVVAVTVYRGRASVTRRASVTLEPGVYDLRFARLPPAIQPETIQARTSDGATVLELAYGERAVGEAGSPEIAGLDARIEAAKLEIDAIAGEHEVVRGAERFVDAVAARGAEDASAQAGTRALDLDAVRDQLAFVTAERTRLLAARRDLEARHRAAERRLGLLEAERTDIGGRGLVERSVVATVAVTAAGTATVDLVHLVAEASWAPSYAIRAATDGSLVTIEYDAVLAQRTGEDWADVRLTLSTAVPTLAANPPELDPWFVDVRPRGAATAVAPPASRTLDRRRAAVAGAAGEDAPALEEALKAFAADAEVAGAGPSVTYVLPRPVSVTSHARRDQRTRIATIDAPPEYIHVALPLLTEAVYVRSALTNGSSYQLLPGPASIFIGPDYVGPTSLGAVPPRGRFDLYLGIDQAVTVTRTLISKTTSKTGLLGGGRKTSYDYRVAVSNGAGKAIALELWDRVPVSRSDKIQIELADLSHPLDTDADYLEEKRPRGLLRWLLTVPPNPAAGGDALTLTYGVRVARAKDVEMTPLPE
jgi:uncharacterized protein (TIGR02231 family)